jgi:hypothetical protein
MSALPPKADIPAPRGKNKSEMAGDREKRHIDLPHAPLAPALKRKKRPLLCPQFFVAAFFRRWRALRSIRHNFGPNRGVF